MKVAIQLMILMACFIIVLKQYRRQPQMYLLVTLITLGLLGLFIGPVVMVLFVTLWQEPQAMPHVKTRRSIHH